MGMPNEARELHGPPRLGFAVQRVHVLKWPREGDPRVPRAEIKLAWPPPQSPRLAEARADLSLNMIRLRPCLGYSGHGANHPQTGADDSF